MDKYNKKIDEYFKIYLEQEEKRSIIGNIWQGAKRGLKTLGGAGLELADAAVLGGAGKAILDTYGKIKAGNEAENQRKQQETWSDYTNKQRESKIEKSRTMPGKDKTNLTELYNIVRNCYMNANKTTPVDYSSLFKTIIPPYNTVKMQKLSDKLLPTAIKSTYTILMEEVNNYLTAKSKRKPPHGLNNLTAGEFKQYFDGTYTYPSSTTTSNKVFVVHEFLQWLHDKIINL